MIWAIKIRVCAVFCAILLCGCLENKGEFEAINVGKVNAIYENGVLRILDSRDGNLSLDKHSADLGIFGVSQTQSLVSTPKIPKNNESHTENPSVVLNANNSNESSLRDSRSESKQSKEKSNPCDSTESRPLRGAKNREQGCSSATADFLLEAEKRGSPPKSEKATAFWRVGGAGRGVQPFLREDSSESRGQSGKNLADSLLQQGDSNDSMSSGLDSSLRTSASLRMTKSMDCFGDKSPRNDENIAESKTTSDSRGSILDEKSGLCSHEQGNRTNRPLTKRVASLPDLSLKDNRNFILFFFTTTCGVCKAQIPILQEMAQELSSENVKIYGILGNAPSADLAQKYAKSNAISLPLFYENSARRFFSQIVGGVKGVPVIVIFKDGKIKERFIGLTPKSVLKRAII